MQRAGLPVPWDCGCGVRNKHSKQRRSRLLPDSSGQTVEEQQEQDFDGAGSEKDRQVTQTAFASLAASEMTYANGRQVTYNHDAMYRRTDIEDGGSSIARWTFWGSGRVAELSLGNGQVCTWLNNTRTNAAVGG